MDEPEESWSATESLLIAIHEELDAVEDLASSRGAEQSFGEMAERLRNALALAQAGEILAAKA